MKSITFITILIAGFLSTSCVETPKSRANKSDIIDEVIDETSTSNLPTKERNPSNFGRCIGGFSDLEKLCPSDDNQLNGNIVSTIVPNCSESKKCEYICIDGAVFNGELCIPNEITDVQLIEEQSKLTLKVLGLEVGERIRFYKDNRCTRTILDKQFLENQSHIEFSISKSNLTIGSNNFYFTRETTKGRVSNCPKIASATYQMQETPEDSYTCVGSIPQRARLCQNDNIDIKTYTTNTLVRSCSNLNKCEYICNPGLIINGGKCIPDAVRYISLKSESSTHYQFNLFNFQKNSFIHFYKDSNCTERILRKKIPGNSDVLTVNKSVFTTKDVKIYATRKLPGDFALSPESTCPSHPFFTDTIETPQIPD